MHVSQHAERCRAKFGQGFEEVHAWLDQFFAVFQGLPHRIILHHRLGAALAGVIFGPGAEEAAKLHIVDDCGRVPLGPEDYLVKPAYAPPRGAEASLARYLEAMLDHALDFRAGRTVARNNRCRCGFRGSFLRAAGGDVCPWCRGVGLDLGTKFGLLAELAAGHRFRKAGLSAEQAAIVTAGLGPGGTCPPRPGVGPAAWAGGPC